mgnify:CR=1 FL=1
MQYGVVFPQTEFGSDPGAIRAYAQAVEALGYSHIMAYEHILGANPDRPGGLRGPYTYHDSFLEPFVLFSHMAAVTERLGFLTGILILPQRETALVAKQAATLDVLCKGRFRLGVGLGWNAVEFQALTQDFRARGARIEAQVPLLRRLWTEPLVTHKDPWHCFDEVGINPLPVQRPIPIWFGGSAEAAIRRMAYLGDGWLPESKRATQAEPLLDLLAYHLQEAGRPRDSFGVEARVYLYDRAEWDTIVRDWKLRGATHLSINTMRAGLQTPDQHIGALQAFARFVGIGT